MYVPKSKERGMIIVYSNSSSDFFNTDFFIFLFLYRGYYMNWVPDLTLIFQKIINQK